jgi:hypothetical protein
MTAGKLGIAMLVTFLVRIPLDVIWRVPWIVSFAAGFFACVVVLELLDLYGDER